MKARQYEDAVLAQHPRQKTLSAARFMNCVQTPLFPRTDDTDVLQLIPPMELHLMLGIVKRLVDEVEIQLATIPGVHFIKYKCPYYKCKFGV